MLSADFWPILKDLLPAIIGVFGVLWATHAQGRAADNRWWREKRIEEYSSLTNYLKQSRALRIEAADFGTEEATTTLKKTDACILIAGPTARLALEDFKTAYRDWIVEVELAKDDPEVNFDGVPLPAFKLRELTRLEDAFRKDLGASTMRERLVLRYRKGVRTFGRIYRRYRTWRVKRKGGFVLEGYSRNVKD